MNNFLIRTRDLMLMGLLLAGAAYSLMLKPMPEIMINDKSYRSTNEYQKAVSQSLKGFANRNKITIDEKAVISRLTAEFPEIKSAKLQMPLVGQTPRVEINVSPPVLFVQAKGVIYVVDAQGRIIGPNTDFKSIEGLIFVNDESGFNARVGDQILTAQAVTFINVLSRQLALSKVEIESITLPALANELHLRPSGSSFYVKFNLVGDPAIQAGQFLAVKAHLSSTGQQPVEYIDARISGKVFYK